MEEDSSHPDPADLCQQFDSTNWSSVSAGKRGLWPSRLAAVAAAE